MEGAGEPASGTEHIMDEELRELLGKIIEDDSAEYKERGFQRRVGYGTRPALIHIDMANAWTRPGHVFSCQNMETIIPSCRDLNRAAREKDVPVIYTTTAYDVTDRDKPSDMGLWASKIPLETLAVNTEAVQIDSRIAPEPGELVITKKRASAFAGTNLAQVLTAARIDTIIVTGVTAAGCVRHTVEDGIAEGFRPIVVQEAVGDRVAGVVEWNLFDIDAKFGDVEQLSAVIAYLERLPKFSDTLST